MKSGKRGQLALAMPNGWGGRRAGAGRPLKGPRRRDPHRPRPFHDRRHPVHVTMRLLPDMPNIRRRYLANTIGGAIADTRRIRVIEMSIQTNHLHLIIEAADRQTLIRGVQGLAIRVARRLNKVLGRKGRVFEERYFPRAVKTPRETRNALGYVLLNSYKHNPRNKGVDYYSSGRWFEGWTNPPKRPTAPSPTVAPRTWLLRHGWRKHGLLTAPS